MNELLRRCRSDYNLNKDLDLVKEIIYKKIMTAMTGKISTTKLDKKELSEVVEYVTMWMNKELGVNVPFGRGNV